MTRNPCCAARRRLAAVFASLSFLPIAGGAIAQDLVITGVVDGPLIGGVPKAVELYVLNDVTDLSSYGVSSANNGAGPTGAPEFTFPAVGVSAGTFLYVASEATGFSDFFGFAPDYTSSAASINGDDAIELFENGVVVDVFGDVNVDGTGQPWDHVDGWAYRVADTGPDGSTFVLANWTFSGIDAFDGESSNATAATPFPIGGYTSGGGDTAPRVTSSVPANGDSGVAVDTDIVLTFSEPVTVTEPWFDIACSVSGAHAATAGSADNVTFTLAVASAFTLGESCTVTVVATQVSDVDADDPPDTMAADFVATFEVQAPALTGVVINEISADPDATAGDANGDGVVNTSEDEFVEIVNVSGADLDVSGWTISDAVGVRHTFPAGSTVTDDCAIVVFGGGTPSGQFGGAAVQASSTGQLGLNNGGDTVTLDNGGGEIISVAYGSEGGNNQSLTRNPDITGEFVQHTTVNGALFTPGARNDGSAFAGCTASVERVAIYDVQGSGTSSPYAGQTVVIEGIVTGDFQDDDADTQSSLGGFYVQEAVTDGDPATSDGIFVYDGFDPALDVSVGDAVRVTGLVTEFFGETQVSPTAVEIIGSGNIAPTAVSLPTANVLTMSSGEYFGDLEQYEGMLVTFTDTLTVTDTFNLDRFGELLLVAGPRPYQFTEKNAPDAAGLDAHLQALGALGIMLDDGLTVQNPDPIRYPAPGLPNAVDAVVRSGDTVSGLTGNLRYSRGSGGSGDELYRLMPTVEPVFVNDNPRPAAAPDVGGDLRVVSLNTLNFFTTLDEPGATCGPVPQDCRGANTAAEYGRQLQKLVTALAGLDADVIGLVELENNASESLAAIVDALNAATGKSFARVDTGMIGTDAIKVGFIYDTSTVALLGSHAILDSGVDPTFLDDKNRPVLAQSFSELASSEVFTAATMHLKSKGSDCDDVGDPDTGDGQGNCNLTRTGAAQSVINWLATDPTGSGDPDVLVLGDYNAYRQEDPINVFRSAGYTDLIDTFVGEGAYSYNFDRQLGALDHAFSSPSLTEQVSGASEWHVNADEADVFDYNLEFGRNPAIFDGDSPFRAADHDPLIVGLSLGPDESADDDNDGVPNVGDVCPGTAIPESAPTHFLLGTRWALVDGDTEFDSGWFWDWWKHRGYSTADTAGCSCEQIVAETGASALNLKFGCSELLMRYWTRQVR